MDARARRRLCAGDGVFRREGAAGGRQRREAGRASGCSIAGGGKGAAIGGVIGGTGAVVATKGKEVRLGAGDTVTTRLRESLTIRVPAEKN
jgi:hypothetical protein